MLARLPQSSRLTGTVTGVLASVLGQRRGKAAKTALEQGTCSAWAFESLCSAEPQGLPLLDKRCLSEKKLKVIYHCRSIKSLFDLTTVHYAPFQTL